ncbi:MAG: SDR family oxidoreductase, partial [Bacteroidota bacterium]
MHPLAFQQKVAIITGAASGIGRGIAQALCELGVKVVMNDLDSERLARLHQAWQQKGYHCHPVPGDAAESSTIDALIQYALQRYGRLDFCIPNAARTDFGDFFAFDGERFDQLMRLNLRASFLLTQAAAIAMKAQQQGGKILLLSSNIAQRPYPQLTAYSMSKAALQMMVQSLVLSLSPYQITIN